MARHVVFRDRRVSVVLGLVTMVAGTYLIYDAYEGRGQHRPFLLRWLPG